MTGSNVGLGKEAARHFVRLGASLVVLAVRNLESGALAREDILKSNPHRDSSCVEVWRLDLSDFSSVVQFADRARALPRLDVVIENAAVAFFRSSVEIVESVGHERTIVVNVLGTYLLALLLLPKLKTDAKKLGTHVTLSVVTSELHAWPRFPEKKAVTNAKDGKEGGVFAMLSDPQSKTMRERYATSKLLEVLVNREMAPRLKDSGVVLNMLNPGLCHSELTRDVGWIMNVYKFFLARTTEVGARTLVAAATVGPESHGKYMHDAKVADEELSEFVKSEEGMKIGKQVYEELLEILERVQPGISANV